MKVLLVTPEHLVLRSLEGEIGDRQVRTSQSNLLDHLDDLSPAAIVFCGNQTDSLEQAVVVRKTAKYRSLPIAILSDEGMDLLTASATRAHDGFGLAQWLRNLWTGLPNGTCVPRRVLIDMRAREVSVMKKVAICSPMEFRLLVLFLRYPDIVFSRQEIVTRIREGVSVVDSRIIDVLVRRVRKKIEVTAEVPMHLHTIYGLGYMFQTGKDMFIDVESRQPFSVTQTICNILFITSLLCCDPSLLNFLTFDAISGAL